MSAAGIFQSNLSQSRQDSSPGQEARVEFEKHLCAQIHDEFDLYEVAEQNSIQTTMLALGIDMKQ